MQMKQERSRARKAVEGNSKWAAPTGVGSHTTLGLKGGSTARFSSRVQLMVLKKGWIFMFPFTPSLLVVSLSSSCNPAGALVSTRGLGKSRASANPKRAQGCPGRSSPALWPSPGPLEPRGSSLACCPPGSPRHNRPSSRAAGTFRRGPVSKSSGVYWVFAICLGRPEHHTFMFPSPKLCEAGSPTASLWQIRRQTQSLASGLSPDPKLKITVPG